MECPLISPKLSHTPGDGPVGPNEHSLLLDLFRQARATNATHLYIGAKGLEYLPETLGDLETVEVRFF